MGFLRSACLVVGQVFTMLCYSCMHVSLFIGDKVDALAAELAAKTRLGIAAPFLMQDLREYLPFWAHAAHENGCWF